MKGNAIIRIVIYGLLIGFLLLILVGALGYDLYFSNGRITRSDVPVPTESLNIINQQEISTQVQNIEIEWVAGSIAIHRSDSLSHINVYEMCPPDSEFQMVLKQSGQTLKIQFCEESMKFPSFGINTDIRKDLVITVPKNWNCNNLEIDAAAADVTVQNLTINELDFDGASGNLILDNCNIATLDIDTASGDIEFVGTLENLDFDAASAKFYGEFHLVPRHLDLDAMSGDLELVLPPNSGFELKLDSMSGSFNTDFTYGKYEDLYICGEGNCKINVSALSGDVNILKGIDLTAGKNCDH